jgi:peptidyl-Lys metalloendopeptidase
MFTSTLPIALLTILVSSAVVSAAPALSVKVSGPANVVGVQALKLVTTVKNTGDQPLKLLKDPKGPLSPLPANTFDVVNAQGAHPAFTGIVAKYLPEQVAAQGDGSTFTNLGPGQSTQVTHDLSRAYDFASTGEGEYTFTANKLFHYIDHSKNVVPITATVEPYKVTITGPLTAPKFKTPSTYHGCSADQRGALKRASYSGDQYAKEGYAYTQDLVAGTPRYNTWFGAFSAARHATVLDHFQKISSHSFTQYSYDCTCKDSGVYAYVFPDQFGIVYLCGAFWNAPLTGTDSKAGTLVHESSHFLDNGGTQDVVYGQSGCKALAISDPDHAVQNADTHEYYCENTPSQV